MLLLPCAKFVKMTRNVLPAGAPPCLTLAIKHVLGTHVRLKSLGQSRPACHQRTCRLFMRAEQGSPVKLVRPDTGFAGASALLSYLHPSPQLALVYAQFSTHCSKIPKRPAVPAPRATSGPTLCMRLTNTTQQRLLLTPPYLTADEWLPPQSKQPASCLPL